MARRPKYSVTEFTEGDGCIVRGTQDPAEALRVLCMDWLDDSVEWEQRGFEVYRPRHELPEGHPGRFVPEPWTGLDGTVYGPHYDEQPDPQAVRAFGDLLHALLSGDKKGYHHHDSGWFRWNPSSTYDREYEGIHSWICKVDGPGRGRFQGVIFY